MLFFQHPFSFPRSWRLTRQITVRVIADSAMVAAALLIGVIVRFLWDIDVEAPAVSHRALLVEYLHDSLTGIAMLLIISLSVFALSGFYTRGRAYRSRYKALMILQAVASSYLVFGFLGFVFKGLIKVPRGALVPAFILTLVFLIGARFWAKIWKTMILIEERLYGRDAPKEKIERVLVIGGAGYIGSALLPKLLKKGYQVRLFDLLLFGTEPIADVIHHPNLEIIKADFRQVDKIVEAIRDIDAVIHLGAIVGDPACALDEELTIEVNLMATRMIAEVARGSGVRRFIFASTCSVYGASDEILDERSALRPVSLYARSKIASEKVLAQMADEHFAPVILRFGTIYGLSGRTRFDLVVNLFVAKALFDGQITVFGGDQWRPFVHVEDAACALLKALEAPEALVRQQVFNVGSNEQNYTIQDIAGIVHRLVPTAGVICKDGDTDRRNYRVNFDHIRNVLGFVPQWTPEQGIQQVAQAIRAGKITDYQDAKYSNVKFLGVPTSARLIPRQNGWVYELLNETSYRLDERRRGERRKVSLGPPRDMPERRKSERRRLAPETAAASHVGQPALVWPVEPAGLETGMLRI